MASIVIPQKMLPLCLRAVCGSTSLNSVCLLANRLMISVSDTTPISLPVLYSFSNRFGAEAEAAAAAAATPDCGPPLAGSSTEDNIGDGEL